MKWKSDNGLVQAELTPIRTLRMDNEQYCREYREVIMQNEKSESKYGISCRVGKEMENKADTSQWGIQFYVAGWEVLFKFFHNPGRW